MGLVAGGAHLAHHASDLADGLDLRQRLVDIAQFKPVVCISFTRAKTTDRHSIVTVR